MLQVDLLHHSILGRRARVQSDDHHVQANLPAAKTTTHTMRNRNIETAKLACFLNSLRPSLIRVVRRKNIERTKRKIGIAAAMKAMILKIIVHSQCRLLRAQMTLPHFSVSSAMSLLKSAGEPASAELPKSASCAWKLASARLALTCVFNLLMISAGVVLGAAMPYHPLAS